MDYSDLHILIVEDEPKIAALLADYLHQQGGFSTSHLSRGDEVLGWVQSHSPDLILLDLMLPGMDGIEVCKQVRAQSAVPIIMITARVFSRDQLMNEMYPDYRIVSDRAVDTHIKNLRKKLTDAGAGKDLVESVYGLGYRYAGS